MQPIWRYRFVALRLPASNRGASYLLIRSRNDLPAAVLPSTGPLGLGLRFGLLSIAPVFAPDLFSREDFQARALLRGELAIRFVGRSAQFPHARPASSRKRSRS